MTNKSNPQRNPKLWRQLVDSYIGFASALQNFLSDRVDRVGLISDALQSADRTTAIFLLRYLETSELQQLFQELVFLASFSHGATKTIHDIIVSLPRDWVLANIEDAAEKTLGNGSYEEYRGLLGLYIRLDKGLMLKLAKRAISNPDPDIREAGEDFLSK